MAMADDSNAIYKRDAFLDVLKGVGIALVVFGHIVRSLLTSDIGFPPSFKMVDFTIYTTHMPLFFMIAGYNCCGSLSRRTTTSFVSSRWGALLWPYVFWSAAFLVFQWAGRFATKINNPHDITEMLQIIWAPIGIFWFLYAMFILQIVAIPFRNKPLLFLLFSIILSGYVTLYGSEIPDILSATFAQSPFFATGCLLFNARMSLSDRRVCSIGSASTALIIFVFGLIVAFSLGLARPVSILTLPLSAAGIVTLLNFAFGVETVSPGAARHVAMLGRNSFQIYILHIFVMPFIPRTLHSVGVHSYTVIIAATTLIGLYLPIVIYKIVMRTDLGDFVALSGKAPRPKLEMPSLF